MSSSQIKLLSKLRILVNFKVNVGGEDDIYSKLSKISRKTLETSAWAKNFRSLSQKMTELQNFILKDISSFSTEHKSHPFSFFAHFLSFFLPETSSFV